MAKNIVILGAGFGGLKTSFALEKKIKKLGLNDKYQIILIDKKTYHTFTPILYEVSTNLKHSEKLSNFAAYPIKEILNGKNITFINNEVQHLDLSENKVHLENSKIDFDYLVLAVGCEVNDFGIAGLQEYAMNLKTYDDALKIQNLLKEKLLFLGQNNFKVAVGGAGATGVELASEIKLLRPEKIEVSLIEALPTILPGLDKKVVKKTKKRLAKIDVKILANYAVKNVEEKMIYFANGAKLDFDIFVWTGGIKAMPLAQQLLLKKEKRGRIEIVNSMECIPENPDLRVIKNIFAVGDIACVYDANGKPIPQMARPAIEEAEVAVKNIIEEIKKENGLIREVHKHQFAPKTYPYVIPVGGRWAIAKIGPFVFSGIFGWLFKKIIELNYFLSILPISKAIRMLTK